jgi:hypothetical protein
MSSGVLHVRLPHGEAKEMPAGAVASAVPHTLRRSARQKRAPRHGCAGLAGSSGNNTRWPAWAACAHAVRAGKPLAGPGVAARRRGCTSVAVHLSRGAWRGWASRKQRLVVTSAHSGAGSGQQTFQCRGGRVVCTGEGGGHKACAKQRGSHETEGRRPTEFGFWHLAAGERMTGAACISV